MEKKLYKSRTDIKIDGVCAGVARYVNADVTVVRLIWALAVLFTSGGGFIAYIVCAMIMPREPKIDEQPIDMRNQMEN